MNFHLAPELNPPDTDAKARSDQVEDLEENIRILLVEDEIPILTVFERILVSQGLANPSRG